MSNVQCSARKIGLHFERLSYQIGTRVNRMSIFGCYGAFGGSTSICDRIRDIKFVKYDTPRDVDESQSVLI